MKKRGVALAFLIGIVIALIIFVPTVMFIAKLFTAGMQARDSTEKLTEEIIALSQGNIPKKVELLTMDENSAVLGFTGGAPGYSLVIDNHRTVSAKYPEECEGESCLCLCEKVGISGSSPAEAITCEKRTCWKTGELKLSGCFQSVTYQTQVPGEVGEGTHEETFTSTFESQNGFLLWRYEYITLYPFTFKNRRNPFTINLLEPGRVEVCN